VTQKNFLPAYFKGVKFRSRLEARWAYYFDLIGVEWDYEPQGFNLRSGNYCPDFYVCGAFIEIKPYHFDFDPRIKEHLNEVITAIFQCLDLTRLTKSAAYVFCGPPRPIMQSGYDSNSDDSNIILNKSSVTTNGGFLSLPKSVGFLDAISKEYWKLEDHRAVQLARNLQFDRAGRAVL
jgi:hypothetical protein